MNKLQTDRSQRSMLRQIAELPDLPAQTLRERWRDLFGSEPPTYNKPFLVKRIAYRIQELASGGLSEQTQQRLDTILDEAGFSNLGLKTGKARTPQSEYKQFIIGTRFRREWNGQVYEVTVERTGFEYEGKVYRHLSPIAKAITGQHLSGNAFFGVKATKGG